MRLDGKVAIVQLHLQEESDLPAHSVLHEKEQLYIWPPEIWSAQRIVQKN